MEVVKTKLVGDYLVYSNGDIRSFKRKGRLIKGNVGRDGYNRVYINGRLEMRHRVILSAFIENTKNKRTVNHIDGNKLNNSLNNLEWATDSENRQHAWDNGLMENARSALKIRNMNYVNGKWHKA